jgi:hypothetical protein
MTITQTIEIPANSRSITVEVPREIPSGRTIIAFTPADDCSLCAEHRDPKTGELRFNAETVAAIEEGRAMMRGDPPARRFNSFDDMWEDLMNDDHTD